ncbi:MAG: hypothetical protein U9Q82_12900 [Chloroflexota bacterium]|nr:hypothetical protein [Chloroflexota bacterium]
MLNKATLKKVLGELPLTAELYWYLRQGGEPPVGGYRQEQLREALPAWLDQAQSVERKASQPKRVLLFSMLKYWLEHSTLMGLALTSLGHDVTMTYLPYAHWKKPIPRFDLRRQDLYIRNTLAPVQSRMQVVSLLDAELADTIPAELDAKMEAAAFRDTQYSLLREDVERDSELYRLRLKRNRTHARVMLAWMQCNRPDVVIIPNGSILEFGITYLVARYLGIPVMTVEFGEQSERMWLAQNADVMRQDTAELWDAVRDDALSDDEWERVKAFFSVRQGGGLWENFARRWQKTPSQGAESVRRELGLDSRPIVLLPTNVLGDSLTLGRQLFSNSMTEWLQRTIEYFVKRKDVQLVIKTHPGEQLGWGPAVYDILGQMFPQLPENVRLLPAGAKVNAYDLVNIADLGLVFTTTLGMEMAMSGLPVIVTGQTHYRGKGFTLDPDSWDAFFEILARVLENPREHIPSRKQVESAWTYAYRFFFEYPQPYPWHVQYFWDDVEKWSLEQALSEKGMSLFGDTFDYLTGKSIQWKK